jgi:hypothetical protein
MLRHLLLGRQEPASQQQLIREACPEERLIPRTVVFGVSSYYRKAYQEGITQPQLEDLQATLLRSM